MINNKNSLDFLGKRCKNNSHNLCDGQWKGLGFQVYCNCECHRKLVLGKDVLYYTNFNEKKVIPEETIGEFNI